MNVQVFDELSKDYYGYREELNDLRNNIDDINQDVWKTVRWIINDYDFLVKNPIINRAFYKYWEIVHKFNFCDIDKSTDLVVHLCEAPGGFIQVSQKIFNRNCKNQKKKILIDEDGYQTIVKEPKLTETSPLNIISMSLNRDIEEYKKYNLPSYNEAIFSKNVLISYGVDNTGSIINLDNVIHIKNSVNNSCKNVKIITADGGFDEGNDFNNKEQLHYSLIIHEILAMLMLSETGSHFVLKMYDTYTKTSVDMLYMLHLMFTSVEIFKPLTSRPTNSEKYIICKDLKINATIKTNVINKLKQLSEIIKNKKDGSYHFTLFDKLPEQFVKYITDINLRILDNQCHHLKNAIHYSSLSKEELKSFLDSNKYKLKNKKEKTFKEWSLTYNFN